MSSQVAGIKMCPKCDTHLRPRVHRVRPVERMPELATVRWECPTCGWSSSDV